MLHGVTTPTDPQTAVDPAGGLGSVEAVSAALDASDYLADDGLATVVFHTAAGANEIPALTVEVAGQVRDRIATLARTADEL